MAHYLFIVLVLGYSCFFFADLLIRKYSFSENSFLFILKRSAFTSILALAWLYFSGAIIYSPSFSSSIQIIGCSLLCGLGLFFFVLANKSLPFPNVITINLFGLILQELISYFLLKEQLKDSFVPAMTISICGLLLMSSLPKSRIGLFYSILSTCFWAIGYALLSIPLKSTRIEWVTLMMEVTILALCLLFLLFRKNISFKDISLKSGLKTKNIIYPIIAMVTISGSLLMNYAYQHFKVAEISFFYITLFPMAILFSRLYFKERLSKIDWISNTLVIAGIVFYLVY
jgi:drug/metabolite transporter (DMT)-like permease